jgi:hypothetical protein
VKAKGGQLVFRVLLWRRVKQPRAPPERRDDFLTVGQRHNQLRIRARGVHGLHRFKLLIRSVHTIFDTGVVEHGSRRGSALALSPRFGRDGDHMAVLRREPGRSRATLTAALAAVKARH